MKFVDEVVICVEVGDGGNGCLSFWREKYIEYGGFDGGNGGVGGSVLLQVDNGLNILVDYCYECLFKVQCGEGGVGCNCMGVSGEDFVFRVLVGIIVIDEDIDEVLGDLLKYGD